MGDYMKEDFFLIVESFHLDDVGTTNHFVPKAEDHLKKYEVVYLDIANSDEISRDNYRPEEDPRLVKSAITGRGPLLDQWQNTCKPIMTVYKILSYQFKVPAY